MIGDLRDPSFPGVAYFASFLSKIADPDLIFQYASDLLERDQLIGAQVFLYSAMDTYMLQYMLSNIH